MTVTIVVGAQGGDEGKGKVVDLLSEESSMVVRYGGGANAGHTLVIDGQQLVTHLVPSGVLHEGTRCVLGDGMVIDLDTLPGAVSQPCFRQSMSSARQAAGSSPSRRSISARATTTRPPTRIAASSPRCTSA